jgi:hypothetical protein
MADDPDTRRFLTELFGEREAPAEPAAEPEPSSIEDCSDEELTAQREAIDAERQRREDEAQANDFRDALARSRTKPAHRALVDGLHGGDDE